MQVQENTVQDIVHRRRTAVTGHAGNPEAVPSARPGRAGKRAFDILFSLFIILFIFPWLFPVICLLISLDSRGGVFFVQQRNGLHNKLFRCYKFRTMVVNEHADIIAAGDNDHRITRIGYFLRVSGLDELPQLFNVLKGDMSIVGPRPHMVNDNLRFEKMAEHYNRRNLVKPGITGLAQVNGYKGNAVDANSIRMRTAMDLQYVGNRSLLLDMKIIAATAKLMVAEVFKMKRER